MKKGFKKLFAKKQQLQESEAEETAPSQPEGYVAMDSKSLQSLSNQELSNIIYRYDAEVKNLNKQLVENIEVGIAKEKDYKQCQEELKLYKDHLEVSFI